MASRKTNDGSECGYTCGFVDEPPELFKCGVCRLVLRDPQITECCKKNACRPCIEKAAKNTGLCPIPGCTSDRIKGFNDRTLKYEILERKVYCYLKEEGCQWVDKLEYLENHLDEECLFVEMKCHYRCGASVQRQTIKEHEVVCQRFPLKCHQCGSMYERQHHSHHIKACPYTTVECPFKIAGCMSIVLNKDLQQHFKEAISYHYQLVVSQSRDVETQVNDMKVTLLEQNEKVSTRNAEVAALNNEVIIAQEKVNKLQKALNEAELEIEVLKKEHTEMKAKLQSQINQRDTTLTSLKQNLDKLIVESKVQCYGPALPRPHLTDIFSRPLNCPPTTIEYTPAISFSLLNFHKERENDALLCLPPFFSHHGGYKMCLLVYCNGYGEARNKSLTISTRILKGQYDEHLQWPLNCKIMIELKNIRNQAIQRRKYLEIKSQFSVAGNNYFHHKSSFSNIIELRLLRLLVDGCLIIEVSNCKVTVNH